MALATELFAKLAQDEIERLKGELAAEKLSVERHRISHDMQAQMAALGQAQQGNLLGLGGAISGGLLDAAYSARAQSQAYDKMQFDDCRRGMGAFRGRSNLGGFVSSKETTEKPKFNPIKIRFDSPYKKRG